MSHRIWTLICPLRDLEGKCLHLGTHTIIEYLAQCWEASQSQLLLLGATGNSECGEVTGPENWLLEWGKAACLGLLSGIQTSYLQLL
jgi:hypothetical protein